MRAKGDEKSERNGKRSGAGYYKGVAKVDGQVVCEAEVSAMLVSDEKKA